jgi:DNA (cytosine-5)-methyltransferase 1
MYKATVNSYFSGAGLFDIGLTIGGLNIIQSFEIDSDCCETQKINFSHKINQCDIREKTVLQDDISDVMVATYPCTKYSTAADIHNTRTGDDLFLHFFRHIAIRRPEIYVVENVPGMRKFPVVMEAMSKLPDYYVSVFCPVNANEWLPQHRKRLILIGSKRNFIWRPPLVSNPVKLKDIIEKDVQMDIPDYVYKRLNGSYRDKPIISDPEKGDIAPTCVAHYSKDRGTRLVKDLSFKYGVRPYTVKEYGRLQGVPDWFKFHGSESNKYKQIGNGVPVCLGEWVAENINRYFN